MGLMCRDDRSILPEEVAQLDEAWTAWLTLSRLAEPQSSILRRLPWTGGNGCVLRVSDLQDRAIALARMVVQIAVRSLTDDPEFPVEGEDYVCRAFGDGRERREKADGYFEIASQFRPSSIYRWIEADYPSDRIQRILNQRRSERLSSNLRLARNDKITRKKGFVVIPVSMWVDEFRSRWSSAARGLHWSMTCCDRLARAIQDLGAVIGPVLDDSARAAFEVRRHEFERLLGEDDLASRQRIELGPDVNMICYKGRVDLALSERAAAALNQFVGTEW